jgi:ABC-type polysaccharide/polyol phosphate export permease
MTLFNQGVNMSADAIAGGASVLTKVYVRPELFALSATISSAINFLMGMIPLSVVLIISGKIPGIKSIFVIVVMLCMTLFTTGIGLFLAISYIKFDDSRNLVSIILLMLQYMTPVFYPISVLGPHTRAVIEINPLTSIAQVYRDVFGSNQHASLTNWLVMIFASTITFGLGMRYFRRKWPTAVAKL